MEIIKVENPRKKAVGIFGDLRQWAGLLDSHSHMVTGLLNCNSSLEFITGII